MKYVLITAARNESAFIERTLQSVVAQTHKPERWVIMDDGSTDETANLVEKYASEHPWIELIRQSQRDDRSFAGKASAVNYGVGRMANIAFDVVGNLDADVSFEPDYAQFVLEKMEEDPLLGLAGTPFTEAGGYDSTRDSFEGENYVAGPFQLFRRDCWQDIGGYIANPAGGVDWIAATTARMKGWKVRAFPEKRFHHHRSMGTAERGIHASLFTYGEKDYYLGGCLVWELFRCVYRLAKRPYITGGIALASGYVWAALRRTPRVVSGELMRFHRREQMTKLRIILGNLFRGKKIDNFSLVPADRS